MITSGLVKADVVDIRKPASATPAEIVADANVLYWVFYPNFDSLQYAAGSRPAAYQGREYPGYWKRATKAKTLFHTAAATLEEFAKLAEHAELEAIWLTDPSSPQPDPAIPVAHFSPRMCKFARYHYAHHLATIRKDIESMLASIRKSVILLPQFATPEALHIESLSEWRPSYADFPDAAMIASAKQQTKLHVLSDDMDIATFPGITLYTANQKAIDAANAAGKLI